LAFLTSSFCSDSFAFPSGQTGFFLENIVESESKRPGMPRKEWAEVEYPLAGFSREECEAQARSAYARIVEIVTRRGLKRKSNFRESYPEAKERGLRFSGETLNGVLEEMNAGLYGSPLG
jgi:hypothetical protein